MEEIVEHNTWIQGRINMNFLKDEWDRCIPMWKDGQGKLSEEGSCKNSMRGMIFVVSSYIRVQICTRKMKGHELLMIFFWEKDGRMRVEYFFFLKQGFIRSIFLFKKWSTKSYVGEGGEQHEISSGYQSHCNLHIVQSPGFFW